MVPSTTEMGLLTPINEIKIILCRHTQRHISQVILELVKLTALIVIAALFSP